jgi:hypothetical protein
MKKRVLLSALSSVVLVSCAMSDDDDVIGDDDPGVQEPGMNQFTAGQNSRMNSMWNSFR